MRIPALTFAAVLAVASPAAAQDVAAAPVAITTESQALIRDHMEKRKAELTPLLTRKRTLQAQFDALLTPETYDEAKLAEAMAELRGVESEIVEKTGSSMLALLKALPSADRALFLKGLKTRPLRPAVPANMEPGEGR